MPYRLPLGAAEGSPPAALDLFLEPLEPLADTLLRRTPERA